MWNSKNLMRQSSFMYDGLIKVASIVFLNSQYS